MFCTANASSSNQQEKCIFLLLSFFDGLSQNIYFHYQDSEIIYHSHGAELKGKSLSDKDKRVLVARIVAKARSLTVNAGNAKRHDIFKTMAHFPAKPSELKLRVLPSYTLFLCPDVEVQVVPPNPPPP